MADVRLFKGLRYNLSKTGDLSSVICPPYDIISPEQQEELLAKSEANIVRVELAKEFPTDTPRNNRYVRAARQLRVWIESGVLTRDEAPGFYLVRHDFEFQGRKVSRRELMACLRLEEFEKGVVRPHEDTAAKAKQDRLDLMLACRANVSPIMMLYDDARGRIDAILSKFEEGPAFAKCKMGNESFSLRAVASEEETTRLRRLFKNKSLYIADGHHRYETALKYRDMMRVSAEGGWTAVSAFNFVMVSLIAFNDPGLLMLPYHRVLKNLAPSQLSNLAQHLGKVFAVSTVPSRSRDPLRMARTIEQVFQRSAGAQMVVFGLPGHGLQVLNREGRLASAPFNNRSDGNGLAVNTFRESVLKPVLGISEEEASKAGKLEFVHDIPQAITKVWSGQAQVAFFPRPATLPALKAVADAGKPMPPKSTYFYPKLPTGLVMNLLDGEI